MVTLALLLLLIMVVGIACVVCVLAYVAATALRCRDDDLEAAMQRHPSGKSRGVGEMSK